MKKEMFLIVVILVGFVLLIGGTLIDSCWFNPGDEVVTKRGGRIFTEPLPRQASSVTADLKTICYLEAGEEVVIATDTTGCMTQIVLSDFDCWQFVVADNCQGWVLGSNLSRIVKDKE